MLAAAVGAIELATKHYGTVEVYTDQLGAQLLAPLAPADYVVCQDDVHEAAPISLWCAGKLRTYGLQCGPFLHFDLDVLLHQPLPAEVIKAPVGCQSLEDVTGRWYNVAETLQAYGPLPDWARVRDVYAVKPPNVGILVMQDANLAQRYAKAFFDFVEVHQARMRTAAQRPHPCLLEQHLLGVLCEAEGVPVVPLLKAGEPAIGPRYTHFVGNLKTDKFAMQKVKPWMTAAVKEAAANLDSWRV